MTLRTRSRLVALSSALLFLVLLGVFLVTDQDRTRLKEKLEFSQSLTVQTVKLNRVLALYLLQPRAHPRAEVEAEFAALDGVLQSDGEAIAESIQDDPATRVAWEGLRRLLDDLRARIAGLDGNVAGPQGAQPEGDAPDLILTDSGTLALVTCQLTQGAAERLVTLTAQEKLTLGILLAGMAGLGLGSFLVFQRTILDPVQQLQTAAVRISGGETHLRLKSRRRDELRQLADAFDRMLDQLEESTVSRARLEAEIAARARVLRALRASQRGFRDLVRNLPAGVVVHGADGRILFSNPMAAQLLGLTADQLRGTTASDPAWAFVRPSGARLPVDEFPVQRVLTTGTQVQNLNLGILSADRTSTIWVQCEAHPVADEQGQISQIVVTFFDISERRRAEDEARLAQARFQRLMDANAIGVVVTDSSGTILEANDYYLNLLDCTRAQLAAGAANWRERTPPEWLSADERAIAELNATGRCPPYEKEYLRRDGSRIPLLLAGTLLPGAEAQILGLALDMTERKRLERELRQLAVTDPLTGAYNRRHLLETLAAETQRAQRYGKPLALIMFDIDHFKTINDTQGHGQGDAVLVAIVAQVGLRLRRTDILARWGGEEFLILLPETCLVRALALAERLRTGLHTLSCPGAGTMTASFGVAEYCPGETLDQWLKRTDDLMFQAKREGRNRVAGGA
ncbi:diguanylate cyclase [Candidatus Thiodictyon syntrophicum]|jgi:diguanylate cyclase (GGDEF)-like protein/PAS domain S-box-containing protein|uniref:Sensor domain-containing diguanylate cyclase n=1 Tax=Candidatus Thiodictyon syntrophicum TaxID=1166950 RepID=A0A2K8UEI2_9GAMM|nr:diguanylate cyclase [Candidatus Thiodictyon syntrophicum]AUB83993.1 hypothetical protein THSYN_25700 [Candidatus Thiodictyon syntrophicum]